MSPAVAAFRIDRRFPEARRHDLGMPALRDVARLRQDDLIDGVVIVRASAMHAEIMDGAATLSF